jgi:hypothetical protein
LQPDLFPQLHLEFVGHHRHVLEIITLLALRRQVPALLACIDLLGALTPLFSPFNDLLPVLLISRLFFGSTNPPLGFTALAIFSFEVGVSSPLVFKLFRIVIDTSQAVRIRLPRLEVCMDQLVHSNCKLAITGVGLSLIDFEGLCPRVGSLRNRTVQNARV